MVRNEKYRFLQLLMEGKILGHSGSGWWKTSRNARDWYGKNTTSGNVLSGNSQDNSLVDGDLEMNVTSLINR